jgi:shikimate kinase
MYRPFLFMSEPRNIYLVGLMGAGKTTIAKQLAKRLKRPFFDTDHEIERRTGVKVPLIFEIEGEAGFRDRESRVLEELSQGVGQIIATGGGIVLREENRAILMRSGMVVYLRAEPEMLYERTRRDTNRPLLQVADPLARLQTLYRERDPLYSQVAMLVVECHRGAASTLVKKIESELGL